MSAVMKQEQNNEITVVQSKSLSEMLVLTEQAPADFFKNPIYLENVKANRELTSNLTYAIDDDGEKQAKADVAQMRKYAKNVRGLANSVFKALTDTIKGKCDCFTDEAKLIEGNADKIMPQFDEQKKVKLDNVKKILLTDLCEQRKTLGIRKEFIVDNTDISDMVKLNGTLTPKGLLTKKAIEFTAAIAKAELFNQQRYDGRMLILENRCLREEINPPLSPVYLGTAFNGTDKEFNDKLESLIKIELDRRAETEARIIKQQEAQKQKEIDAALKAQQEEANRIALENAANEQPKTTIRYVSTPAYSPNGPTANINTPWKEEPRKAEETPETLRASADRIDQSAQYADRNEDRKREMTTANELRKQADDLEKQQQNEVIRPSIATGLRTVVITARYELENMSNNVTDDDLVKMFEDTMSPQHKKRLRKILHTSVPQEA